MGLSSMAPGVEQRALRADYEHVRRGLGAIEATEIAQDRARVAVGAAPAAFMLALAVAPSTFPCLPGADDDR